MANRYRFLAAALLSLLIAGSAGRAAVTYGDLEMAVLPEPKGQHTHGYTEYRILVRNKGSERTRRVTLVVPGDTFGPRRGSLQGVSRTVDVGPGLIAPITLLQPAQPDIIGRGIKVIIDGRQEEAMLPLNPLSSAGGMGAYGYTRSYGRRGGMYMYAGMSGGPTHPLLLISRDVNENFFKRRVRAAAPMGMAPGGVFPGGIGGPAGLPPPPAVGPVPPPPPPGGFGGPAAGGPAPPMGGPVGFMIIDAFNAQFIRADVPITEWTSNRWLAYTRYDGIVVTRDDLEALRRGTNDNRAVLQALWQWTEAGGALVVLGPGLPDIPAAWKRHPRRQNGATTYRVGFGSCIIPNDRNSAKWSDERWNAIAQPCGQTGMPWASSRSLFDLNTSFPVVDELGVPVRGLFALMILFSIALGPVNLVVLARKNKRIWMLWTVPALSAVTCLAVLGYMIIAEGWQGHARVGGITFLNEIDHRATTLGRAAFYSPLTPGDGLRFSDETEVQMQGGDVGTLSSSCTVDWTNGQHLARGWVTARVPAHFMLRKSELRRERLNVRREADGSLGLVNALGADIKALWVADENGQIYEAGSIAAGERATLQPSRKGRVKGWPNEAWRSLYSNGDWATTNANAAKRPQEHLGPGTYLAVVDGSPFLEQPLRGAAVRTSDSVVLGVLADFGK
jgi:hypothetical protein